MSFLSFTAALILDSVARSRAEQLRIHYLTLPALQRSASAPKGTAETDRAKTGRTARAAAKGDASRAA
jgi:hypothetical protein